MLRAGTIDKFVGKYVRYWTTDMGIDEECVCGWLISYDCHGLLFSAESAESKKDINGASFVPWVRLREINYFRGDDQ